MPEVFRFTESRDSRSTTVLPPSETKIYTAAGSNDDDYVRAFALNATPIILPTIRGTLYRHDIRIDPLGYKLWRVEIPYGPNPIDTGQWRLSFDTTGGTLSITNSIETITKYTAAGAPKAAPDQGGALNVRGDQIDGAEVVVPALKITATFTHPQGVISLPQIKNLARWTGRFNSTPFLTFAPGEVLFLGVTGDEGSDVQTTAQYQFAMSENLLGATIGPFTNVDKRGWEYAWISYRDAVANGSPVKQPQWLYVERIYRPVNLALALGFGG